MVPHKVDRVVVAAEGAGLEEPYRWPEEIGQVRESRDPVHVEWRALHLPTQPVIQSQVGPQAPGVLAVDTAHVGARPGHVLWSSILERVGVHDRAIYNSVHARREQVVE